jgi:hypothetical protein
VWGHNGTYTTSELIGNTVLQYNGQKITLTNVLYSPKFSNLISDQKILAKNDSNLKRVGEKRWLDINGQQMFDFGQGHEKIWVKEDEKKEERRNFT